MAKVKVKEVKQIDLKNRFNFGFLVGASDDKARVNATNKNTNYAGGRAKVRASKKSNTSNNDIIGYFLKRKLNVLAIPFQKKRGELSQLSEHFKNIALDNHKDMNIKEVEKNLEKIVKDDMKKGYFGRYPNGFRHTVRTGQLYDSITSNFVENAKEYKK